MGITTPGFMRRNDCYSHRDEAGQLDALGRGGCARNERHRKAIRADPVYAGGMAERPRTFKMAPMCQGQQA